MSQTASGWPGRGGWVHLVMSLSDCVKEVRLELEELGAQDGYLPGSMRKSIRLLEAGEEVLRRAAYQLESARESAEP